MAREWLTIVRSGVFNGWESWFEFYRFLKCQRYHVWIEVGTIRRCVKRVRILFDHVFFSSYEGRGNFSFEFVVCEVFCFARRGMIWGDASATYILAAEFGSINKANGYWIALLSLSWTIWAFSKFHFSIECADLPLIMINLINYINKYTLIKKAEISWWERGCWEWNAWGMAVIPLLILVKDILE